MAAMKEAGERARIAKVKSVAANVDSALSAALLAYSVG